MRPSYGQDQEAAASALSDLLRFKAEDLPHGEPVQLQMLRCREAALDALIERVAMLGVDQVAVSNLLRSRQSLNASTFHRPGGALTWLATSLRAAPRLPVEMRHSPADALATASADPMVETWRTVGRRLLSATHWLREDRSVQWTDAGTGWALLDDVAVAAEAITALDSRAARILTARCEKRDPYEPDRLGYLLVQRMAAWHGDGHDQLDNARRAVDLRPVPGSVEVVDDPIMFKVAHQRLQAFLDLRTRAGQGGAAGTTNHRASLDLMDRSTAVIALEAQVGFVSALEKTLGEAGAKWAPLAASAGEQRERLQDVRAEISTLRLRSRLNGHGAGAALGEDRRVAVMHPVVLQSRELHRGTRLVYQVPSRLDVDDVAELLGRSHQVQRLLAERIRREVASGNGTLGLAAATGPRDVAADSAALRHTPMWKALVALRDAEAPPQPRTVHAHTGREQLRLHLEAVAPAGLGHPSPYGGKTTGPTL